MNRKNKLNPYLNFNGRCREAMIFYKDCFDGTLVMQKIAESPMAAQLSSEAGNNILHSTLTSGNIVLMGSDMIGNSLSSGNTIALCLNCNTRTDLEMYFNKLASGGQILIPPHRTFWGSLYGELTDKFGTKWMLSLNAR